MAFFPQYRNELSWKNVHKDNISSSLASLRRNPKFSDLLFVCQSGNIDVSGRRINAHTAVFSSASKFCRELFEAAREKQPYDEIVISIDLVYPVVLEKLIEYMYEGKTSVNVKQKEELINLCKSLQLEIPLQPSKPSSQLIIKSTFSISEIVGEPQSIVDTRWKTPCDIFLPSVKKDPSISDKYFNVKLEKYVSKDVSSVDSEILNTYKELEKGTIGSKSIDTGYYSNSDKNTSSLIHKQNSEQYQVMPMQDLAITLKRIPVVTKCNNPKNRNVGNDSQKIKHNCDRCDFSTKKDSLRRHANDVHLKIKEFVCDKCEFATTRKSYLKNHVNTVHLKIKELYCNQCDFSTSQKAGLKRHVKCVHLKIKDCYCDICGYSTISRSNLVRHVKGSHLKIRNFACDSCGFSAFKKSRLKTHVEEVHLKIKRFNCNHCEFISYGKCNLKRHTNNMHTDVKKMPSGDCEYSTTQ